MAGSGQPQLKLAVTPEGCDLSKAQYSPRLSGIDHDAATQIFWGTFDRLAFNSPYEIVKKVLEVHGFVINIENLLACIDELTLGFRVALNPKELSQEVPAAKEFLPALQFRLPDRKKIGPLLRKFYDEVEGYEAEILKLRQDPSNTGRKNKTAELERQVQQLQNENKDLRQQLHAVAGELDQMRKLQSQAFRALETQNVLPPELRNATVKNVDLSQRRIVVRVGRSTTTFSTQEVLYLPKVDERCIIRLDRGEFRGAYFYESTPEQQVTPSIGTILFRKGSMINIRDRERRRWVLEAQDKQEATLLESFRRGDRILFWTKDQAIIGLRAIRGVDTRVFADRVQEALVLHQLVQAYIERVEPGRDEVA